MPYAFLTSDGSVKQVVAKLSPFMKVEDGERIANYNPPIVDDSVYVATPVTPVPAEAMDVQFVVEPLPDEVVWPVIRARRDVLIAKTDWTQLPDVPLPTKEAWATYRQELRDITLQADPHNIIWPTPPQ
jgi:hypothetical protein